MKMHLLCFLPLFLGLAFACKHKKTGDSQALEQALQTTGGIPAAVIMAVSDSTLVWAGNTDPVCNMAIDQTTEDTVHYNGKIYGFCNPHCKDKFKEEPAAYTASK